MLFSVAVASSDKTEINGNRSSAAQRSPPTICRHFVGYNIQYVLYLFGCSRYDSAFRCTLAWAGCVRCLFAFISIRRNLVPNLNNISSSQIENNTEWESKNFITYFDSLWLLLLMLVFRILLLLIFFAIQRRRELPFWHRRILRAWVTCSAWRWQCLISFLAVGFIL